MPIALLPDVIHLGIIELRRWREDHVDVLVDAIAASLPELRCWMPWAQEVPTRAEELTVVRGFDESFDAGREFHFGIFEPGGSAVVGGCGLHRRHRPGTAEIGYWARTDRHRRGYATAAARALTAAALVHLRDVNEVHITMDTANIASAGVPAKLGYECRGGEDSEVLAPSRTGRNLRWVMKRSPLDGEARDAGHDPGVVGRRPR